MVSCVAKYYDDYYLILRLISQNNDVYIDVKRSYGPMSVILSRYGKYFHVSILCGLYIVMATGLGQGWQPDKLLHACSLPSGGQLANPLRINFTGLM